MRERGTDTGGVGGGEFKRGDSRAARECVADGGDSARGLGDVTAHLRGGETRWLEHIVVWL